MSSGQQFSHSRNGLFEGLNVLVEFGQKVDEQIGGVYDKLAEVEGTSLFVGEVSELVTVYEVWEEDEELIFRNQVLVRIGSTPSTVIASLISP